MISNPRAQQTRRFARNGVPLIRSANSTDVERFYTEARVQTATTRIEKITQAILAKAFRGELVPTEVELARRESRPYEPASALLTRIRARRAAQEPNSKPRMRSGKTRACRAGERRTCLLSAPAGHCRLGIGRARRSDPAIVPAEPDRHCAAILGLAA